VTVVMTRSLSGKVFVPATSCLCSRCAIQNTEVGWADSVGYATDEGKCQSKHTVDGLNPQPA
jgi:hypothetical protein